MGSDVVNTAQDITSQDDDFDVVLTSTEFDNNPYAILGEDEEDGENLDDAFLEQDQSKTRTFGKINKDLWIGDSGASTHMTNSLVGMTEWKDIGGSVTFGNNQSLDVKQIGKKKGKIFLKN